MFRPSGAYFLLNIIRSASIEPVYFVFAVAYNLCYFVNTNLMLQKACRLNSTTEPDLRTPCDDTEKGVNFVTFLNSHFMFLKMTLIILMIIFLTAWSDKIGKKRKIFILLPIIGLLLESGGGCLYSYMWTLHPILTAIVDFVLEITFGSELTLLIFSEIYLSEVVSTENRTMRLGIFGGTKLFSFLPSRGLAGYVLHYFGFFWSYFICFNMAFVALVLAFILVRDRPINVDKKISICQAYSWRQTKDSLTTILGQRNRIQRAIVVLLLAMHTILLFVEAGKFRKIYVNN